MKKSLLLLLSVVVLLPAVSAQTTEVGSKPLEVYKTADDFFSNKKTTLGECHSLRKHVFKCSGGKEIDITAGEYFGFTWGSDATEDKNRRIILHPKNKRMLTYMGGCKDLMFYMPASVEVTGKFADNGDFLEGPITSRGERPEFIKEADFTKKTLNLEDALSGKPEVVRNFKAERKTVTINEWSRRRLYYYHKYVRQYCDGVQK
jgi:hypothetical protein